MKFSFRKLLAFVLPLAMVMVSCNDDDPSYSNPYLTVGNRNVSFTKDGGTATFEIDANRSWTITASETWLVASPASDDNKTGVEKRSTVTITATANEGGPRNATLTIASPAMTDPIIINVAQEGEGATAIKDVAAMEKGSQVTLKGTVAAVTTQSFVMADNTGAILIYLGTESTVTVAIGDKVTVKGKTDAYNGLPQIAKDGVEVTKTGTDATWAPTPTEITADEFTAYAENLSVKYVKMAGKYSFSDSGKGYNYYNFNMTGSSAKGSFSYTPDNLVAGFENNSNVIVEGYLIGVNTSNYTQIALVKMTIDEGYVEPEKPEATTATIADVLAGTNGDAFKVEGTVGAVTKKSFILVDATGALNIYSNGTPKAGDAELKVGDNVTVEGVRGEYQSAAQLNEPVVTAREGAAVALPTAEEYDAAKLDAYIDNPTTKLVKIAGTYSVSGTYYNLNIDGLNEAKGGSFYQTPASVIGDIQSGTPVVVEGYLVGYNNGKYVNIHAVKMDVDATPYLNVATTVYEVAAAGGDVEIAVNTNIENWTATVSEEWTKTMAEGKVTVTVPENTAAEGRTATVTISAEGVEDVVVTIKQEGASAGEPVKYELVTDAATLAEGDEIIFVGLIKSSGVYHVAADPNYASGTTYLKTIIVDAPTDNVITITGEKIDVFAVEASGTFFKFKSAEQGKYLGYKGNGNYITYDAGDDVIDEWSIAAGADNAMTITLNGQDTSGNDRFFQWNANNTRFSAYKSSSNQADAMIFRKVTE